MWSLPARRRGLGTTYAEMMFVREVEAVKCFLQLWIQSSTDAGSSRDAILAWNDPNEMVSRILTISIVESEVRGPKIRSGSAAKVEISKLRSTVAITLHSGIALRK